LIASSVDVENVVRGYVRVGNSSRRSQIWLGFLFRGGVMDNASMTPKHTTVADFLRDAKFAPLPPPLVERMRRLPQLASIEPKSNAPLPPFAPTTEREELQLQIVSLIEANLAALSRELVQAFLEQPMRPAEPLPTRARASDH
jgi:hypothetical protein